MSKGEEIPREIMKRLKIWNSVSGKLRILHIFLGIIAIISSITVAARVFDVNDVFMPWVAWLAAISSTLLTSMNLGTKSNQVRTAWRILNEAVLRFQTEDHFPIEKLNDAYKTGEKTVGDVEIKLF